MNACRFSKLIFRAFIVSLNRPDCNSGMEFFLTCQGYILTGCGIGKGDIKRAGAVLQRFGIIISIECHFRFDAISCSCRACPSSLEHQQVSSPRNQIQVVFYI